MINPILEQQKRELEKINICMEWLIKNIHKVKPETLIKTL